MQEIKCPNCGEVIQVDESDYMQIVQQVRDKEFDKELDRREQALKAQQAALRLLKMVWRWTTVRKKLPEFFLKSM